MLVNIRKITRNHFAEGRSEKYYYFNPERRIWYPPGEIENIFEPFYRMEENRGTGGFGLGLSLAQKIVKLHRGEITVDSKQGEKTVFNIFLSSAWHLKEI